MIDDRTERLVELFRAIAAGDNAAVSRVLFAAGGVTPMHTAVRTRCAAAVQAMLERGGDPRAKNDAGSTPLHLAVQTTGKGGSSSPEARAQQAKIVGLLIEHGARTSKRDGRGKTVAQRARGASLPFVAALAA